MVKALLSKGYCILNSTKKWDFIAPLLLRLYLVPIFWMAGTTKIDGFDNIVQWFGNDDWGLGLPFPYILAILAVGAEVIGAIALLVGLGVRLMAVPLMITMFIAMTSVHGQYGWQAIADANAPFANERVEATVEKKEIIISILQEHGNYEWLTSSGNIAILNNGIEFAATYFIMLLALFFIGGGRYVSLDYWFKRNFIPTT
jgi:uncharacterized membrane protein YphA (DoxX/SURF4 family)